jgi:hypothetical protein
VALVAAVSAAVPMAALRVMSVGPRVPLIGGGGRREPECRDRSHGAEGAEQPRPAACRRW